MDEARATAGIDWTALISLVIAAATLLVVLGQERRHRLRAQPAAWTSTVAGIMGDPDASTRHFVTLSQYGSHTVRVLGVTTFGCRPKTTINHRVKSFVFRSGDTADLLFDSDDPENAWLLITWISLDDRSVGRTEWIPLMTTGPLAEVRWQQFLQEPKRYWHQRMWPRQSELLRRVGPDYSPWRRQAKSPRQLKGIERMLEEVAELDRQGAEGALGN